MGATVLKQFGTEDEPMVLVHGGAGVRRHPLTSDQEEAARRALAGAVQAGQKILSQGGGALDAAIAAVRVLEDSAEFNSAHGAALTREGTVELDACVMSGDGRTGAVTGVSNVRNPILAARAVMERTSHVLLAQPSDELMTEWGLELVDPSYFITERRIQELAEIQRALAPVYGHGTVGAVARDASGHVAAATSTGGMVNQMAGRIGDSPIVGAGTYANDATVAVSCTGTGEAFMRIVAAHSIHDLVALANLTVDDAVSQTLDSVADLGGSGGVIVMPPKGPSVVGCNSGAMFYGFGGGESVVTHV